MTCDDYKSEPSRAGRLAALKTSSHCSQQMRSGQQQQQQQQQQQALQAADPGISHQELQVTTTPLLSKCWSHCELRTATRLPTRRRGERRGDRREEGRRGDRALGQDGEK